MLTLLNNPPVSHMAFSVIQTSRRFVSSSSCGAPFGKFVTSGIGQRGGGGNMRAAEHFLTNILTVWTHNQWSLVFIDFCGFKHLFLNKNSWKQQNGHLTMSELTWITRGYLDTIPLQVHGTIWTTMVRWWPHQYWAWDLGPLGYNGHGDLTQPNPTFSLNSCNVVM